MLDGTDGTPRRIRDQFDTVGGTGIPRRWQILLLPRLGADEIEPSPRDEGRIVVRRDGIGENTRGSRSHCRHPRRAQVRGEGGVGGGLVVVERTRDDGRRRRRRRRMWGGGIQSYHVDRRPSRPRHPMDERNTQSRGRRPPRRIRRRQDGRAHHRHWYGGGGEDEVGGRGHYDLRRPRTSQGVVVPVVVPVGADRIGRDAGDTELDDEDRYQLREVAVPTEVDALGHSIV
mmetsp:Transcript_60487/g.179227  ORF Transcript_60487/g.179227 Transcript_60487/m.179227 type:complete len:230 (+) Transcript_60487:408-1097(+)